VVIMAVLVWIIYRSRLPGRRDRIHRDVSAGGAAAGVRFGMMWAWLIIPIPIYGTLWLLADRLFHGVPAARRAHHRRVVLQIDKSLEECARVCGASWGYQMRTVTLPLLRPGSSPPGCCCSSPACASSAPRSS
jgi:iron(III) transport system permease protein